MAETQSDQMSAEKNKITNSLTVNDAKFPATENVRNNILVEWEQSSHARSAVNCVDCHAAKTDINPTAAWQRKPSLQACQQCHELENETYQLGKHGMRLAQKLPPLNTDLARLPMRNDIEDKQHDCLSCHGSHDFNTQRAAVDACLTCHDDEHSKAYRNSPHYDLWRKASIGRVEDNAGVSCATCHLPRMTAKHKGKKRTLVQHNQNHNLRPNEKMIRDVCLSCHGLGFSIDALADTTLVANNFNGNPKENIPSIAMAVKREKEKAAEKRKKKPGKPDNKSLNND